jgi:aryl-alcohol dehydrogenase-like predicted oxidoreductase
METRPIGSPIAGSLAASAIGLGCNNFGPRLDADRTAAVVDAALDAGVTFFDTADIYGNGASEEFIGRALARNGRRREVVIATKFGHHSGHPDRGGSPAWVRQACDASLRRLGVDVIDLYQLHSPDPRVPVAETLGALDELVRAGKVREVGCSNFSPSQLGDADAAARDRGGARFVSVQNEYSLLKREAEGGVLDECEALGLAFLPYFPLASGLLSGKYRRGRPLPEGTRIIAHVASGGRYAALLTDANLDAVERLAAWAEARGHTLLDLAFAWLLAHPRVASVIAGATSPEQVRANAATAAWRLTPAERAEVDALAPPA